MYGTDWLSFYSFTPTCNCRTCSALLPVCFTWETSNLKRTAEDMPASAATRRYTGCRRWDSNYFNYSLFCSSDDLLCPSCCCVAAGNPHSGATPGLNSQKDRSQSRGGAQSLLSGPCSICQGCPCQSCLWAHLQLARRQDQWVFSQQGKIILTLTFTPQKTVAA